jgi:DNA (cytosine-5)-methyltransferase 1
MVERLRPRWLIYENVPGLLSSNQGKDFGAVLGALAERGYGFAYRVCNSKFWNLAQSRARVFLVASASADWERCAKVLLDEKSIAGDSRSGAPSQPATPAAIRVGPPQGNRSIVEVDQAFDNHPAASRITGPIDTANTLTKRMGTGGGNVPFVVSQAYSVREDAKAGNFSATPIEQAGTLTKTWPGESSHHAQTMIVEAVRRTFRNTGQSFFREGDVSGVITKHYAKQGEQDFVVDPITDSLQVRRFTPLECERLQGFPDNYTDIPFRGKEHVADEHRYAGLGNSMAVPVIRWIGANIARVDAEYRKR